MLKKISQVVVIAAVFSVALPVLAASSEKPVQEVKTVNLIQPANDQKAADALVKKLESLKSLSAKFEQQTVSNNGRIKMEAGEMQMQRPAQFRWLTKLPFELEIVARKNKVWMIDRDLQQVIIQKQDNRMANTPAQLLTGDARSLLKQYNVTRYQSDKFQQYTLVPARSSDLFEKLDINFRNGLLSAIIMKDALGGRRRIDFSDVRENRTLMSDLFEVKIPKDYDLIDETSR
ncbi:outer membrane lipoprotein carrier protein LolA [Endozoicomonas sp. OPT23]|uniref:outer membrane lipoprotein chaperone LolA n=1 Tax=Endozoicomonas sp. OPT23 TaxID=2072845 RepID=UPI00129AA560|nr:outer membrane lipoprotein chaperone LolA [Endozoicomonas sp. OPT23]MRI34435.1 outer membrane lipoprotein carrier protein LolA [Endozoicomonas sp. OPT23]